MEIQLVLGANSSGKSKYAEELAVAAGPGRVYLATMVPQNEENHQRIEKHRIQRKDKDFRTVEEPWHIDKISVDADAVILLEDASNLLANGMFTHGATVENALEKILTLANRCKISTLPIFRSIVLFNQIERFTKLKQNRKLVLTVIAAEAVANQVTDAAIAVCNSTS